MNWSEIGTAAVTGVTVLGFIYTMFRNLRTDLAGYRAEAKEEIRGIKQEIQLIREEMAAQNKRTDKLYEMFIDLIKAQTPKTHP